MSKQRIRLFDVAAEYFENCAVRALCDDAGQWHRLAGHSKLSGSGQLLRNSADAASAVVRGGRSGRSGVASPRSPPLAQTRAVDSDVLRCNACNAEFADDVAHREHFASEWHRLNLKLRLSGVDPVPQPEFERLRSSGEFGEASDESDEASDDDAADDDDHNDEVEALAAQLRAKAGVTDALDERVGESEAVVGRQPYVTLETVDGEHLRLFKSLLRFPRSLDDAALALVVRRFRELRRGPLHIAVLLLVGGRFAGGVFADGKCIAHRARSRYVVRAKQGGSQAAHDTKGRRARSAGAALRRHGAEQLFADVSNALAEWRANLDRCTVVYLSAPGNNRRLFVRRRNDNSPSAVAAIPFAHDDDRVRSIAPLAVARPTFAEVQRVHQTFTSIDVVPAEQVAAEKAALADEQARAAQQASERVADEQARAARAAALAETTKVEPHPLLVAVRAMDGAAIDELFANNASDAEEPYFALVDADTQRQWDREALETPPLYLALKGMRANDTRAAAIFDKLAALAARGCIAVDGAIGEWHLRTALHYALHYDMWPQAEALLRAGADVTRRGTRNRRPIEVATPAAARAMQRLAHDEPALCNWREGRVQALSADDAAREDERARNEERERVEREAREKAEREAREARQREAHADAERRRKEEATRKAQILAARRAIVKRVRASMAAMSEREKRARAAERRIMGAPKCTECGNDVPVVAFEFERNAFCNEKCFTKFHERTATED